MENLENFETELIEQQIEQLEQNPKGHSIYLLQLKQELQRRKNANIIPYKTYDMLNEMESKGKSKYTVEDVVRKLMKETEEFPDGDSKYVIDGLIAKCRKFPELIDKIMQEHKSYAGAFKYFYKKAMDKKAGIVHGQVCYLDNAIALQLAIEYFFFDEAKAEAERKAAEEERRKKLEELQSKKKKTTRKKSTTKKSSTKKVESKKSETESKPELQVDKVIADTKKDVNLSEITELQEPTVVEELEATEKTKEEEKTVTYIPDTVKTIDGCDGQLTFCFS